ncbi:MAG: hypothetical protein PHN39_01570 [Candidatus Pacebacteria bacterium]|nr:hypothetical protein [Candidatus Paceibacterota bacterium]
MDQETRRCQSCKQNFTIESEDFDFYEKIKVPPPTWCWECRMARRMQFRNERALYRAKCELCGNNTLSIYSAEKPFHAYCPQCWWSDNWDVMDYGRDYDFNKPFFQQWRELLEKTPRLALSVHNMVNSTYCNVTQNEKDCYLVSASEGNERTMFSNRAVYNKDSLDLYIGDRDELCYEIVNCLRCYRLFFSRNCIQCQDSAFLVECSNCTHCFGCTNLRNKHYCIFNQQYSKEEYQNKLQASSLGSFLEVQKIREQHKDFLLKNIQRFATIIKSQNATGDNIRNAKGCQFCFDVVGDPSAEESKFAVWTGYDVKDSYDFGPGVGLGIERCYEFFDGLGGSRLFFNAVVYNSSDVYYCMNCHNCSNLFACIGLRNKQYCILNKQYTKESFDELRTKIIQHMNDMPYTDKKGRVYRYGEFFPPELSPFCYNETIAQEYFPLTKEQALEQGYSWKDPEPRDYQITMKTNQLPDHIKDVPDSILQEVIECAHQGNCNEQCTTAFRIIPQELQFYRKMNLPLPRLCPNCRHYQRLKQRNPLKLWKRQCQCHGTHSSNNLYQNTTTHNHGTNPCPNTFQTSYSPDRPEIVYCEECYLKEVV